VEGSLGNECSLEQKTSVGKNGNVSKGAHYPRQVNGVHEPLKMRESPPHSFFVYLEIGLIRPNLSKFGPGPNLDKKGLDSE